MKACLLFGLFLVIAYSDARYQFNDHGHNGHGHHDHDGHDHHGHNGHDHHGHNGHDHHDHDGHDHHDDNEHIKNQGYNTLPYLYSRQSNLQHGKGKYSNDYGHKKWEFPMPLVN
ncbi:hypothetical protein GJ496_005494 [Pomphorhynchus laevis]|nr:hypothetical protein GJ496_005494 [Pomphorhynchus laevis]